MDAGHGGAAGRFDRLEEVALALCICADDRRARVTHETARPARSLSAWRRSLVLCALWAFQQVAIKVTNAGISPAFQSGLRSLGALVLLLLWSSLRKHPAVSARRHAGRRDRRRVPCSPPSSRSSTGRWCSPTSRRSVLFSIRRRSSLRSVRISSPGRASGTGAGGGLARARSPASALAVSDGLSLPTLARVDRRLDDARSLARCGEQPRCSSRRSALARIDPAKTLAYQLAVSGVALTCRCAVLASAASSRSDAAGRRPRSPIQIVIVAFASYLGWFALIRIYPASRLRRSRFSRRSSPSVSARSCRTRNRAPSRRSCSSRLGFGSSTGPRHRKKCSRQCSGRHGADQLHQNECRNMFERDARECRGKPARQRHGRIGE